MSEDMLDTALYYATEYLWPIFLCRGKQPLTRHGFKDATTDPYQIERWLRQHPDANIASPSGIEWDVLDIDDSQAAKRLQEYGVLPVTVKQRTPSGPDRVHHFWNHRAGITNSTGQLPNGIHVRGEGGYVLLPPSKFNGHEYRWLVHPEDQERADWPDWLLAIVQRGRSRSDTDRWEPLDVEAIFEGVDQGERDEKAYKYACSLRARDVPKREALALMKLAWEQMEQPERDEFPLEDAQEKVRRAYKQFPANRVKADKHRRVEFESASSIRSERVLWLWDKRSAQRSLTVVAGEKGKGKSILTNAWIPAKITRGSLDGELKGTPADVLIVSAEDDWRSMIKPRLTAHGADLDRVHRVKVHDDDGEVFLTLPDDVAILEAAITKWRDEGRPIALLVIDPLGAFLSSTTDSYKDASVRRALAPLASMAERMDLAVLVVMHLTKDQTRGLVQRVGGSGAFANASRSVFALVDDPDAVEGKSDRVLIHAACNWGREAQSLKMRIVPTKVSLDDGYREEYGRALFQGFSDVTADDVQTGESRSDAAEAILAALKDGDQWSLDVKDEVRKRLKCSQSTVERAQRELVRTGGMQVVTVGRQTKWRRLYDDDDVNEVNKVNDVNDVDDVSL